MFIYLLAFLAFFGAYYYLSYQVILLNDLHQIFSQTAVKAQEDLKQYSELVLEDLGKCYVTVLLIIFSAAILTFLWILLLKYNAKLIIWVSIFSLPIILSVGLYHSISFYIKLINGNEYQDNEFMDPAQNEQALAFDKALQTILTAELMSYVRNDTLWLVISIILAIILATLSIILHSLRERVSLSIELIRQASKAINGVKSTLLFPIIPRTLGVAVLIYGVLISLLMISASHPTYQIYGGPQHGLPCHPKQFNRTNAPIPQRGVTRVQPASRIKRSPERSAMMEPDQIMSRLPNFSTQILRSGNSSEVGPIRNRSTPASRPIMSSSNEINISSIDVRQLKPQCIMVTKLSRQHVWKYHAINLFATLWLLHFISGISQTTLAGAFAMYYWAYRKPRDVPFFAVTISLGRVLRYHLGDIAFGSFLIATIRYIRIVIELIDRRVRKKGNATGADTSVARSASCFFRVFFWLLDRFLKYIDRNAYIIMSMYGEGYFQSAKRAVELLYKNTTRALVLDYVTYFVLLVSRLLITGIAGALTAHEMVTADLHYKWLPIVLVILGTYFISKGLFSVYSMAVDTLFICFLLDSTNNDGSAERPYFMSKELRRIMKRNTVVP